MRIFLSFLVLFSCSLCRSQELYHRILNADNGLPSNKVHYIFEDSKGYMWFGTENGVCRWDSKNFVTYTIKDGLPNNEVLIIFEDSKGRIWFSTFSNELCYMQNDTIFNRKNDKRLEKISIDKGGKLCEHKGEIYFFSYPNSLLKKIDLKTLEFKGTNIKTISTGNPDIFFYQDKFVSINNTYETIILSHITYDSILFNFANWVFFLDKPNKIRLIDKNYNTYYSMKIDSLLPFLTQHSRDPQYCSDVLLTNNLLGHKLTSLDIIKISTVINKPYPIRPINGIDIKYSGKFNSDLRQFYEFDKDIILINNIFLESKRHSHLRFDYELNYSKILNKKLLIITEDNTLLLNNLNVQNNNAHLDKMNSIHKLFFWNKNLNILYSSGKIKNIVTRLTKNYHVRNKIYNIEFGDNGMPFLISYQQIINLHNGKSLFELTSHYSQRFKGLAFSKKHLLYTINNSGNGLYIQDLNKKATKISNLNAYTSFIDSRDRIWIGTVNKLYVAKTFLPKVEGEKEIKLNKDFDIFCSEIKEDPRGNIFFTTNDGIYIIDKNDKKYHVYDKNYLSSNECVTLKLDSQNQSFFVATRYGVNQIRYELRNGSLQFNVINKFFKEDGLTSNEIKDILIQGDSLWVASAKGLDLISNKNYRPDSLKIPLHINKVIINDSLWTLDSFYQLNHTQNNLKIDYSAIYYQRRDRLDIRYRLIKDGDTTTGSIESSVLQLFSLASGNYTLQLYAYDRDYPYIYSDYKILRFQVSPPYYKTWWFYLLILLAALSILGALMWYRNRNKLEQVKLLGELNKYKLQGLQNQMNPHFVFNSMSTIQDLILTEQNVDALDFISDFSHLMRTMLQNSRNETISLRQEINFLKRYIELEQIRYSQTFDYKFETEIPEDELNDIYIPTMMIQPIVENAIKHGVSNLKERKGLVTVNFALDSEETFLTVMIVDNGLGQSVSSKSKSHSSTAIQIIQERLNIYIKNERRGEYKMTHSSDGTVASLKLPL